MNYYLRQQWECELQRRRERVRVVSCDDSDDVRGMAVVDGTASRGNGGYL